MPRLRRSDPSVPGITRARRGRGWTYTGPNGDPIRDIDVVARLNALVVPPAWQDVWLCPWPNGHIQAVGTDVAGRRQYRYHEEWTARRDAEKFDRVLDFAERLPAIRKKVADDITLPGMPRRRVLACATRLLEIGFFRIGGEEYAEQNHSYGLATLLRAQATLGGGDIPAVTFDYTAKSGKHRVLSIMDADVVEIVGVLLERKNDDNPELLAFQRDGLWVDVKSRDINEYLRDAADGWDATAKDFRTWSATVLAAVGLAVSADAGTSASARKRAINRMYQEVSTYLGNTPAVARTSYVHPRIVDLFLGGQTVAEDLAEIGDGTVLGQLSTEGAVEAAVLDLLRNPRALRSAARRVRAERLAG